MDLGTERLAPRNVGIGQLLALIVAAALSSLCAVAWKLSLVWPTVHDLPIMLYTAMLWDHFAVLPHAGFFDMNVLGSYVAYRGIGRYFGYDAASIRVADLSVFLALGAATCVVMRPFGWAVSWIATALFGLVYLQYGPGMSLQREYLMLLPVALAVAAVTQMAPARIRGPALLAGLGVGIAMTIKPQAAVAALPLAGFVAFASARGQSAHGVRRPVLAALLWLAAGAALALAALCAALVWLGVFGAFFDIAINYLPLYSEMTGHHRILEPGERAHYLLVHWRRLGGQPGWLVAGVVGAAACAAGLERGDPLRSRVALIFGLAVAFALYPLLSGKFWNYHWLPMMYWLVLSASLAFARLAEPRFRVARLAAAALLLALLVHAFPPNEDFGGVLAPTEARSTTADGLAEFLRGRLLPGDTVQPLDWTKASIVHALLLSEAKVATSFLYDFHFYHHVSNPYIQGLRSRFLAELRAARPRFIVKSRLGPFPTGPDTSRTFPQLAQILRAHYVRVADTLAYTVYERLPDGTSAPPRDTGR